MTCVKTGCHIYIIPYGTYTYGDAHQVGDVFFFRLVQESEEPMTKVLHYEVNNYDSWWDKAALRFSRENQVSTLVALASDVLSYGYEGRDINLFPYAN